MLLTKLKQLYEAINNIDPNIKTLIIIVLLGLVYGSGLELRTEDVLKDYSLIIRNEKLIAEKYTLDITPLVNDYVKQILIRDVDASNVLLLNYHNTLTSSHGLSYRYLTTITEKRRGLDSKNCSRIWKELDYINYGDEIEKINNNLFLRITSLEKYELTFPNIVELLKLSKAKSAAFYPIYGIDGYVGMIIVIYPEIKTDYSEYYMKAMNKSTLLLASLLNYNKMLQLYKSTPKGLFEEVFKDIYENRQIK